jgi:cation transport ATPase
VPSPIYSFCLPLAPTWHAATRLMASHVSPACLESRRWACSGAASQLCTILLCCTHAAYAVLIHPRLLLFLIFFPRATPTAIDPPVKPTTATITNHTSSPVPDSTSPTKPSASPSDPDSAHHSTTHPSFRTALLVALTCALHFLLTALLSIYFTLFHSSSLQSWANLLGIFSTILASIQYFPQIYTTYILKRVGSLSIPMMCIQTPGSFVWAGSLAQRLGVEGWSAWGVYCVTGCLQGTLLLMGSYYEIKEKRRERRELEGRMRREGSAESVGEGQADERTPLIMREEDS